MNPYTQGNPYLSQMADTGYVQQQYQPQMQNTGMQDTFQNQAMQTMQNQTAQAGQRPSPAGGTNPLALAQALRGMGSQTPERAFTPQQSWDMAYGTQAQPYQGGATFGLEASQAPGAVYW